MRGKHDSGEINNKNRMLDVWDNDWAKRWGEKPNVCG